MRPYLLWLAATVLGMAGGLFAAILVMLAGRAVHAPPQPAWLEVATIVLGYVVWVAIALAVSWIAWRRLVRRPGG